MNNPLYSPITSQAGSGSIRLLEILLDQEHELHELSCRFHVRPIKNAGPFIALSYTWGPDSPKHKIRVNGHLLSIRTNLNLALWSIRERLREYHGYLAKERKRKQKLFSVPSLSRSKPKTTDSSKYSDFGIPYLAGVETPLFWIDQICINQDDLEERSAQVRLMGSIYRNAQLVLIWLGWSEDADAEQGAVACLERTNKVVHQPSKHWSWPTSEQKTAIRYFCNRDYWTRVWIVQEIMLAKRVLIQVGATLLDYDELMPLFLRGPGNVHLNQTYGNIEETPMGRLLWTKSTLQDLEESGNDITIHMLLTVCGRQQCSDPRDRVYGLLGISRTTRRREEVVANYSISGEELYCKVLANTVKGDFPDQLRAVDLCRKAILALDVDFTHANVLDATAHFIIAVAADNQVCTSSASLGREKVLRAALTKVRWKESTAENIYGQLSSSRETSARIED